MNFEEMSDAIRLHDQPHHGYENHSGIGRAWHSTIDTGHDSAGDGGDGLASGVVMDVPAATFTPINDALAGIPGGADAHQSNLVQIDQSAVQHTGIGGSGGNQNLSEGGDVSVLASGAGHANSALQSGAIQTGVNAAGNGGDGYFFGGIVHASFLLYEPINITVATGYGAIALADQSNDVNINQSAIQMAGIGGNGGNGNIALGGNVGISGAGPAGGSDAITTGANSAGNGGDGYFFGSLVQAPIVIYHPINIAIASGGGIAHANQSNTVEIDQSATQVAGVGGNGGNDNTAIGGNVSTLGSGSGASDGGIGSELIQTGSSQSGNGGDGYSYGGLVHGSLALYDPVNIVVAGYNSSAHVIQTNNVHLDQSSFQMAGVGGGGGNGNVAAGGSATAISSGLGGSDTIATGHNAAGNGGSGHFSGSLVDVSVAIYAPINIAIAGPHSTAEADQANNVHIDQSAVQIAGIGGSGGSDNLALGGDVATQLLHDLHLVG